MINWKAIHNNTTQKRERGEKEMAIYYFINVFSSLFSSKNTQLLITVGKVTGRTQRTYSGSDSSLSETAGTTLSGGNSAGLTVVRPLWITSITYLRDRTTPVVKYRIVLPLCIKLN